MSGAPGEAGRLWAPARFPHSEGDVVQLETRNRSVCAGLGVSLEELAWAWRGLGLGGWPGPGPGRAGLGLTSRIWAGLDGRLGELA